MSRRRRVTVRDVREQIKVLSNRPNRLRDYLDSIIPFLRGPSIYEFSPRKGYPGTMLEINGQNFALTRKDNEVYVSGKKAIVVQSSSIKLKVITDPSTTAGPVEVKVGTHVASGPYEFEIRKYPKPGSEQDGPPILFAGLGQGLPGDVPSTGTLNVLVVLVNPTDRVPANLTTARNTVVQAWDNVHTFYDQASYSRLDVVADVTTNWHTLTGDFDDYVTIAADDPNAPNIRPDVLDRLMAEAAQAAVDEGLSLENYAAMACVINLDGTFIRAWGGWSSSNFSYNDGAGTNISIAVSHAVNLLVVNEVANWGRCAHELGHNIVSVPSGLSASPGAATLGEDVYSSDLVDPSSATAQRFEMMGAHDTHPLFSAYFMEKLGYYDASNVLELQWDRNAFSQEYEVVAHGLAENSTGARYHLIKIRVANGLYYYIEVRQRPGTTTQIFDDQIPLNGATQNGGVVVTKVLTDVVNMNQQLRFITLLHDPRVLKLNETATDPARALKITIVNDNVADRPLVCRVRVEWAQGIADDPNGAFDVNIEPWDSNWQTPDIWIDRPLYGSFDQPLDAENRPQGNGDKPQPNAINLFVARLRCTGTIAATNVRLTYYVVEPPGVGDNGNWGPIQTKVINIPQNGHTDTSINWVPVVDRHTCLKVWAEQQFGEVTGGNNWAQENVFQFEAPASSVPTPVVVSVAVRNPLKRRTIVLLGIKGVPLGFTVHFPHAWLWLDPLGERKFELTVVPTLDYNDYRKREVPRARVRLAGVIPRSYKEKTEPGVFPGSRMFTIGGITAEVTPKRSVDVKLQEDGEFAKSTTKIGLKGSLKPSMAGERLRVDLTDPKDRLRVLEVTTDTQGRFRAVFDLTVRPSLYARPKSRAKEKPLRGVYKAQALVINSPHAAQAESNFAYVSKRAG